MEELRDKNPFHCIITGPTNCGKTRYVIDQLRGSFRHVFEWIVLICPTYSKNKTYRGFAKGDKRFVVLSPDASNVEEINDLLGICEDFFSGKNTLIILDDCAVSKDLKNRTNKFINLAFSGRHAGLSVWVLTQQLTSIAKPFRDNVACVVAFYNPSQIGMKSLFEEFGGDLDSQNSQESHEKPQVRKLFRTLLQPEKPLSLLSSNYEPRGKTRKGLKNLRFRAKL